MKTIAMIPCDNVGNKLFIKEKALRHEEHLAAKHHTKEK